MGNRVLYIPFVLMLTIVSSGMLPTVVTGPIETNIPCPPGEVSKHYTIRHTFNQIATYIICKADVIYIADCIRNECKAHNPSMYALSRSGENCSLTLLNVTVQSSGSYSCEIRDLKTGYPIKSTCDFTTFAFPSVTLECPDTYVEEGKLFYCTCTKGGNLTVPSTTTLRYGTKTFNSPQDVKGSFTADRNLGEITCEAQLPDVTNNGTTQTVQVAYGPSNVALRVFYNYTESDVIRLCDQPVTVTANCSVPANNYNPGVNYQFYSNVTDTSAGPSNMSAVNFTVRTGGLFSFLCTANNSQFSRLSATSLTKIIQVTEPPSPPVIERYQDGGTFVVGDQLIVQEGLAKIRCRVEGGYPPVSAVLLECGSQTSKDNNLYIDVKISRNMHGTNCSCTATHSSSCYRNNKALTVLDVQFSLYSKLDEDSNAIALIVLLFLIIALWLVAIGLSILCTLKKMSRDQNELHATQNNKMATN